MSRNAYSGHRIRQSLLYFLTGKTLSGIVGIFILVLLVRALSPDDYGFYIVLLATFEVLQLASSIGCYPATYRYIPQLNQNGVTQHLRRLVKILLMLRASTLALVASVMLLAGHLIFQWLGFEHGGSVAAIYPLFLFFEGINRFIDQLFDAMMQQGYSQSTILFRNSIRLISLYYLAFYPDVSTAMTIATWLKVEMAASALGFVAAIYFLWRTLPARPSEQQNFEDLKLQRVLDYVIPAYGSQLAWLAQGPDVVKILVARLTDSIQVGAFGFCAALNSMLQRYLPVFLLIGMVRPIFVSAREKGRTQEELVSLASLVLKLNLFLLFPLLATSIVKGNELIDLLSGGAFPEAGLYLAMFLALLIFQSLHTVLGLLAMVQEQGKTMLSAVLWGAIGIVVGLAGSTVAGPMALAGGLILSELIRCLVIYRGLYRNGLKFVTEPSSLCKMAAVSVVSAFSALMLQYMTGLAGLSGLFITLISMGILYIGLSFLTKPFIEQERALINRVLPKPIFVF